MQSGTLNLLEATRRSCITSPFVHMSTNKVYGDKPNTIRLKELETRWDYDDPTYANGITETFSIDASKHSLFGASKVAADIMVQEYGRYFGMKNLLPPRRLSHRPQPQRGRAPRLSLLPREMQSRGQDLQRVRI